MTHPDLGRGADRSRRLNRGAPLALCALVLPALAAPRDESRDVSALRGDDAPRAWMWLEQVGLDSFSQRRGRPRAGRTLRDAPLIVGGVGYAHGIGTRSISEFAVDLRGGARRFRSMVGFDDVVRTGVGSATFEVWADDALVAESGLMRAGDAPRLLTADLTGARVLTLLVDDGGDTSNDDEVAWAGAMIEVADDSPRPRAYLPPTEAAAIIAPAPSSRVPALHGPRVTGATPGRPFLFRVPASGAPPLEFTARGLPAGLTMDAATGIISGTLRDTGQWRVALEVRGAGGRARRALTIVGGTDALARTPPMGWNSWNVWGPAVDQQKVLAAAEWLDRSGLAAHGYQYVVIDDAWMGTRAADGTLRPNGKFPDMRALADAVHARGLKLGIYSSPGPKTCEGYAGSWQHEAQDAATFASWGVDFLKYDWCSYEEHVDGDHSLPTLRKPYALMGDALARTGRDIVFALCQYGYGEVWKWGAEVGGHLWRSSGDLLDQWANLQSVGFRQAGRERWTRPGEWNDTDMLVVGTLGWGPDLRPTRLTQNEQLLHVTLWALQAAPLFVGADLSKLDDFTLALLTNDEVIDVDQDPLGRAARRVWRDARREIWARPLHDGTLAVGLFNRGLAPAQVVAGWAELGLRGRQPVRDLWQRRDLGVFADGFAATVPRHGAVLLRIGRPRRTG